MDFFVEFFRQRMYVYNVGHRNTYLYVSIIRTETLDHQKVLLEEESNLKPRTKFLRAGHMIRILSLITYQKSASPISG